MFMHNHLTIHAVNYQQYVIIQALVYYPYDYYDADVNVYVAPVLDIIFAKFNEYATN